MTTAQARAPVADMAEARLDRLQAEEKELLTRLAATRETISAFCRNWSDEHGYGVRLDPVQIKRAISAGARREIV